MTGSPHPHLRVHAVNVYVRDLEASLHFFVDLLGFELAYEARLQSGDRWVAVSPPDGSALLTLIAPHEDSRDQHYIGRATGVVFVTEDVLARYAEWRKRGVNFLYSPRLRRVKYDSEEQDSVWGGVFTHFRDPDGNTFVLAGFDKVTREIEEQRRAALERVQSEHRRAQELAIATEVQSRLFPQTLPPIATLDYAGACIQARQVGGDYYDFLPLGHGRFALVIGDIAGKGIAAALLMANLQANLRAQCAAAFDRLAHPLAALNKVFHENTTESAYATLFFAEYDDASRRLRYANCGHVAALLLHTDGAIERLKSTGTVLGLFADWNCEIGERTLAPGDVLALYTDGITESFNPNGEEYGEARLVEALRQHRASPPRAILDAIVAEVRRFSPHEQHDDITLIVAKGR